VARRCRTTFRFSGRTYSQLAQIVRELCAVAGRWCLPLVAAVAVTVAVSPGQDALPVAPGVRLVTARTVEGMTPLLAAYLSAHRTMITGSALCAALAVTERD
jgi:hypothetical protein